MSDRFSSHIPAQRSCPNGKTVLLVDEDCGESSTAVPEDPVSG
jgi:hypothetical protein